MLDAMLVFSLTISLTSFFFWVLLEKGCLPALLVLFSPLILLVIIVVVLLFNVIYKLHGILGVISLTLVACVMATPFVIAIGILLDVEYRIDIFKWNLPSFRLSRKSELERLVKAGERRNKRNLKKASKQRKRVENSKRK